jgi:hypothetical protein
MKPRHSPGFFVVTSVKSEFLKRSPRIALEWRASFSFLCMPPGVWAVFLCTTPTDGCAISVETRWDEKAGLRRDAVGSQVIDALEAQEIKETGNEED